MFKLLVFAALWVLVSCGSTESENNNSGEQSICGESADCPTGSHCAADGRCAKTSKCSANSDCAFGTTCVDDRCVSTAVSQTFSAPSQPQIDLLMVVDDTAGMCEIHTEMMRALDGWVSTIRGTGVDMNIAVVSTDVTDVETGAGIFRRAPGEGCVPTTFNVAGCEPRVPGVLRSAEYALDNSESAFAFSNAFRCLAMTGARAGDSPRSGLEAMRLALSDPAQAAEFLRPNAKLAILFVTNTNDCSDGTVGTTVGPVYEQAALDQNSYACEYQRNLEDSCRYTFLSPGMERIGEGDNIKYPWEWCVLGDRDVVSEFGEQIETTCPDDGCANSLIPRTEYYDFLLDLVAQKNGHSDRAAAAADLGVAAITNSDSGTRSDPPSAPVNSCSGTLGYRYDLFARMFGNGVANTCQNWSGIFGATDVLLSQPELRFCVDNYPMACGREEGDTTCIANGSCVTYFEFDPEEYSTCSNSVLRVSVDAGAGPINLTPSIDYRVTYDSRTCLEQTGSPVEIRLIADYDSDVQVTVEYITQP